MVNQKIQTIISINGLNHHDPVHTGTLSLKRNLCPLAHYFVCLHHGLSGEINKLNILSLILVNHILIPVSVLILCKADTHKIVSRNCFKNRLF